MSFKITKNNGIDMLTKNGRFIQSITNFKKDIKSTGSGKVPAFIGNVYKNADNKIKELIEKEVLKKATKINVGGKIYDISNKPKKDKLKKSFEIKQTQLKELIIKSSLRIPVYALRDNKINTVDIEKPLLYKKFDIDTKKDLVNVFTGNIKRIADTKFNFNIGDIKTTYQLSITFDVIFSDNYIERTNILNVNNTFDKLNNTNYVKTNYINDIIDKYKNSGAIDFKNIKYKIISSFKTGKKDVEYMVMLKQENIIYIGNLYNNVINIKNDGVCVYNYVSKIWKHKHYKNLDLLKTPNDIYNFCVSKKIKTICYDIQGYIINANYVNNSKTKSLIYICFNNHIYPIKNQFLEKNNKVVEIKTITDINDKINNLLENGVIPSNIKLDNDNNIISFTNDNIKYIDNPEYDICKRVLVIFGLCDRLYDTIRISNLGNIIEKLYININNSSFMPIEYKKEPYLYSNKNIVYNEITTIDKNKCYSNALYNLDFLIKTDIRCNELYEHIIINNLMFVDEYLYIAKPTKSCILMPNKDFYSGNFLNYCKSQGIEFEVYNTLIGVKLDNQYKSMIIDIYDKLNFDININNECINCGKYIMNILIGKFNQPINKKIHKRNINILPSDDLEYFEGHIKPINDDYNIVFDTYEDVKNIHNKLPIDIQIKDESRKILYNKMIELNITTNNVIQIKTDSITINKKININVSKDWRGWKYENYNPINVSSTKLKHLDIYKLFANLDTLLYDCYAGAGKSHHIKNTYKQHNSYIILTPKHSANKDYKKSGYNCDVIQKYEFSGEIPNSDIIVVDEIGQVSGRGWDVIYKCAIMGKVIKLYGDFKQLSPVDGNIYNTNFWRNYFYYNIKMINTNYRNNNTITYYDDIINAKINYKELVKYNDITSDNIIVYRNKTRIEYNTKICDKKGIKNIYDVGNKIICTDNKLKDINIYNGFTYIIKESYNDYIITDDGIKITKKQLSHFDYGWAMTIHKIQGETLNDFYVAHEDNMFYKNNVLYTIISRLRETLTEETQSKNNKLIHCWE